MRFRYTNKELKEKNDYEMLRCLVVERQSDCDIRSPLHKRLKQLQSKLCKKEALTVNG